MIRFVTHTVGVIDDSQYLAALRAENERLRDTVALERKIKNEYRRKFYDLRRDYKALFKDCKAIAERVCGVDA